MYKCEKMDKYTVNTRKSVEYVQGRIMPCAGPGAVKKWGPYPVLYC